MLTTCVTDVVAGIVSPPERGGARTAVGTTQGTDGRSAAAAVDHAARVASAIGIPIPVGVDGFRLRLWLRLGCGQFLRGGACRCRGSFARRVGENIVVRGTARASGGSACAVATSVAGARTATMFLVLRIGERGCGGCEHSRRRVSL
jgi:hypothetical protein